MCFFRFRHDPDYNKRNFKTFYEFITEVNYGALEKDDRIKKFTNRIKTEITNNLPELKSQVIIDGITINCEIVVEKKEDPSWFCRGAFIINTKKDNTYKIKFIIIKDINISNKEFTIKLHDFFENKESHEFIYHEVKHLLDFHDKIFTYDRYLEAPHLYTPNDHKNLKDISKYISQDKEIDAQLIGVLGELEHIKSKDPNITIDDTLQKSLAYNQFMTFLIPSKRNKYKHNIIHFLRTHSG